MVLVVEDHPIEREPKWSRSLNRPLQHWTRPPRNWSTGPPHAAGTQPSAGVSHRKHTTFILYSQPEDREWNYVHIYLGTFETRSRASPMWSAEATYHYSYQWIQCQNIYLGGQSGLFVRSAKFEDCVPQLAVSQHPSLKRNGNWMSTLYSLSWLHYSLITECGFNSTLSTAFSFPSAPPTRGCWQSHSRMREKV